jgi:Ni/Fe-hydrogenase subunit HybB-like protein
MSKGNEVAKKTSSFPVGTLICSIIALLALPVFIYRFTAGLGAVSNLSDGRPWGLWISFDLFCGVALAAGGFTMAFIAYVIGREKYHQIIRAAILTAFLGYLLVIFALLVDLGQPWFIWHALISWNIHSPMFEVAICVMCYTTVLALEFSPVLWEKLNWQVPMSIIRTIQIPLVIAGICLSTLHQSSLGSLMLLTPYEMNPLWYTPILPLLFYFSAIAVGLAMTIFESTLSSKAFGHEVSLDVLGGLGKILPYILGFYFIVKMGAIIFAGNMGLIFTEYPQNLFWWGEVLIGVLIPIVLFSTPSIQKSRRGLFVASGFVVAGLVFNRFNVTMLGLPTRPNYFYAPSWMEFAISIGLLSIALLIIQLANRLLPIVEHEEVHSPKVEVKQVVAPKAAEQQQASA